MADNQITVSQRERDIMILEWDAQRYYNKILYDRSADSEKFGEYMDRMHQAEREINELRKEVGDD